MGWDNATGAWPWALIVIGGPIALGLALAWAKLQTGKKTRRDDPDTPADDPSKGMPGAGDR